MSETEEEKEQEEIKRRRYGVPWRDRVIPRWTFEAKWVAGGIKSR